MRSALKVLAKRVTRLAPSLGNSPGASAAFRFAPPGHFHSPIPSLNEVKRDEHRLFERGRELVGIDLNEARQLEILRRFRRYYAELPFPQHKIADHRYFYENPWYSYSDAIFLYCMLRDVQPKRIIEVGSGFSSCVTLDTNERFFENRIKCTFIEPNPERLFALITEEDHQRVEIIRKRVQDVDIARFLQLQRDDILFVDSSHVSKIGSDVNYLVEEVLPSLHPGVYIHFHDIFFPFEYPPNWIYEGRAFNEVYLLRAFLAFNHAFEIVFFNTFLEHSHRQEFVRHMPLCLRNEGGSIWLRRVD